MLKSAPPSPLEKQDGARKPAAKRTRSSRPAVEWKALVLDQISPRGLAALNAFYRNRSAVRFEMGGIAAEAAAEWSPSEAANWDATIAVALGTAEASLHVSGNLLVGMLARQNLVADLDRLDPAHAALLVEALVARELTDLEEGLDRPVELKAVSFEPVALKDLARFRLTLQHDEGSPMGLLHFEDEGLALDLARILDNGAPGLGPRAINPLLSLGVCHGAVLITLAELEDLVPGDVVMIDDTLGEAASAMIELNGIFAAPVEFTGSGVRLRDRLRRLDGSRWEWMMSSDQRQSIGMEPQDLDVSDLPVTLVFEAGRATLSVEEVRQLGPGAAIALPDAREDGINIISGGKRIGQGELVRIGQGLGIRIRRILANG